jgi:hypothetical protein
LNWGGWNECPALEEHTVALRSWGDAYGARPVCLITDVLEMAVARPPSTRQAAMELAAAQFAYCSDIVQQGTETISALAANLIDAPFWYFWWD